eukprot:TRINITY_DN4027_c0_g1_i1.p1 TRINITY_DN4027_c0_g1~~TRINITY_DN4027_c0_g1_i1.p1  ORF type:complete len:195 (-),score=55.64 TRINITY_DN4027_c0_g1_i1:60-575(-)
MSRAGLSEFGKQVVRRMEEKKILIDLAHSSEALINDVLAIAKRPVVVSHTGVRAICNNVRNLRDNHIRAIAKTGGVIAIAYFKPAICGDDELKSIVDSIEHVKNVVGAEHVALGSDFDGAVRTPFDTTGLVYITSELMKRGFDETEIKMIMGENIRNLLVQYLPSVFSPSV